jgi:hypothetical protein
MGSELRKGFIVINRLQSATAPRLIRREGDVRLLVQNARRNKTAGETNNKISPSLTATVCRGQRGD